MQRGQCFKRLAPAQCRSFVTMGELEHLRNKLDIHQPAAAFLQIEMGFIFAGQFAFHTHAQMVNFSDSVPR